MKLRKNFIQEKRKKNHTFKNQFIVTPNGREIVDIIVGKPGPTSDINIWRASQNSALVRDIKEIKLT